jgi:CDP-diacylglycerol--glycerol-3-phosphate 3-phosphatidyltransferase
VFLPAFIVFVVAVSTDWVDGYWARRFNQVTKLGRVLDPFVDKVIICSVFIYLSSTPDAGIPAWATVIVIGRELLVTALRGAVEGAGGDFSASLSGKWKMVAQCIVAGASLLALHQEQSVSWVVMTRWTFLIIAILLTLQSAVGYIVTAFRFLGIGQADGQSDDVDDVTDQGVSTE